MKIKGIILLFFLFTYSLFQIQGILFPYFIQLDSTKI